MSENIVLCVDDDTTVLKALRTLLVTQLGGDCVIELAEGGAEAIELVEELAAEGRELALIISDYIMPGMRGDELLIRVHEASPNTVKIMLTGQSDLEGVKRAINSAGLYRFLEKPFDNADLVLTVQSGLRAYNQDRALERHNLQLRRMNDNLERQVEERTGQLQEKNRELEQLAITDRLTGLCNRLKLDQVMATEFARSQRFESGFSLLLLDIDWFKQVNDHHGHQAGDQVLVEMAAILQANTRQFDVVGRWGGEEFLVVACGTTLDGATELAEKLRACVSGFGFTHVGSKTASFGLTSYRPGDTVAAMISRADQALYRAKANGRNRVEAAP